MNETTWLGTTLGITPPECSFTGAVSAWLASRCLVGLGGALVSCPYKRQEHGQEWLCHQRKRQFLGLLADIAVAYVGFAMATPPKAHIGAIEPMMEPIPEGWFAMGCETGRDDEKP